VTQSASGCAQHSLHAEASLPPDRVLARVKHDSAHRAGLMAGPDGYDLSRTLWRDAGWAEVAELRRRLEDLAELRDLVRQLGRASGRGPKRRAPQEARPGPGPGPPQGPGGARGAAGPERRAPQAVLAGGCRAGLRLRRGCYPTVASRLQNWQRTLAAARRDGGRLRCAAPYRLARGKRCWRPVQTPRDRARHPIAARRRLCRLPRAGGGEPATAGPGALGAAAGGDGGADAQRRPLAHAARRGAPARGWLAARGLRRRCARPGARAWRRLSVHLLGGEGPLCSLRAMGLVPRRLPAFCQPMRAPLAGQLSARGH